MAWNISGEDNAYKADGLKFLIRAYIEYVCAYIKKDAFTKDLLSFAPKMEGAIDRLHDIEFQRYGFLGAILEKNMLSKKSYLLFLADIKAKQEYGKETDGWLLVNSMMGLPYYPSMFPEEDFETGNTAVTIAAKKIGSCLLEKDEATAIEVARECIESEVINARLLRAEKAAKRVAVAEHDDHNKSTTKQGKYEQRLRLIADPKADPIESLVEVLSLNKERRSFSRKGRDSHAKGRHKTDWHDRW